MSSLKIITKDNIGIRFDLYWDSAPVTCEAFIKTLPFSRTFFHARQSGLEIWIDNAPELDIIQENASVFTEPGEIVIGPLKPARAKTSKCLGIYYGEGKGIDCCNIFGKVATEDMHKLQALGSSIWTSGKQELKFELVK